MEPANDCLKTSGNANENADKQAGEHEYSNQEPDEINDSIVPGRRFRLWPFLVPFVGVTKGS
jgi:hypothetical protein